MNGVSTAFYLRLLRALAGFSAALAVLLTITCWNGAFDRTLTLAPADIVWKVGNAYTISLKRALPAGDFSAPFYSGDSDEWPIVSTLRLQEDGRVLQPAHSLHVEIAGLGAGRYSHWGQDLIFSSGDNTDPRYNGHRYQVTYPPNLLVLLTLPVISLLGLAGFLFFWARTDRKCRLALVRVYRGWLRLVHDREYVFYRRSAVLAVILTAFSLELCIAFHSGLMPWEHGDGWNYVRLADQLVRIRDSTLLPIASANTLAHCAFQGGPCSPDVLQWQDIFVFLFRMPGYPAVIALCKWLAGENWQIAVVALQHLLALIAACVVYRGAALISGTRLFGLLAAVLFLLSHRLQYDRAILTDSLCASGLTVFICWLLVNHHRRKLPSRLAFLTAGLALATLFLIRETVLVMAAAALPLAAMVAWRAPSRKSCGVRLAALYAPLCAVLFTILVWSYARTGYVFVTTQPLSAGLYAAVRLEDRGIPVFTGDSVLDRVARQTLKEHSYDETMTINRRLLLEYDLSGPEQSALAQAKYFSLWVDHPIEMLRMVWSNIDAHWQNLFIINELMEIVPKFYNAYCAVMVKLAWLCVVIIPLCFAGAAVFVRQLRGAAFAAIGLWIFCALPTTAYAALDIELRYLIFATAPLLLIFALSGRLVGWTLLSIGRARARHAKLKPAAYANLLRDRSG